MYSIQDFKRFSTYLGFSVDARKIIQMKHNPENKKIQKCTTNKMAPLRINT